MQSTNKILLTAKVARLNFSNPIRHDEIPSCTLMLKPPMMRIAILQLPIFVSETRLSGKIHILTTMAAQNNLEDVLHRLKFHLVVWSFRLPCGPFSEILKLLLSLVHVPYEWL
jgi:hypothetical protein